MDFKHKKDQNLKLLWPYLLSKEKSNVVRFSKSYGSIICIIVFEHFWNVRGNSERII